MARAPRTRYVPNFAQTPSFDDQLYLALKKSPWWMLSIAFHVLAFVVLGLLTANRELPSPVAPRTLVEVTSAVAEDDLPPVPVETKPVQPRDEVAREPLPTPPEELDDHPTSDNDLPNDETLGDDDGESLADLRGPSVNAIIGVGPGWAKGRRGRGGDRNAGPDGGGGSKDTERAVEDALSWLAAHQSPNGAWEAAGFADWCNGKPMHTGLDGRGSPSADVGVTGLALLAFLGAGYTQRGTHPFTKVVARGLRYLRSVQDPEGFIGPRTFQGANYAHAMGALALVEAYGMTGSPVLRGPAQKAIDYICLARNPYLAWRYGVKPGDNDTSVTGWMMMALKSAKLITQDARQRGSRLRLDVDEDAFQGLRTWLQRMTDEDTGRVGYVTRGSGPARRQDLLDRFPAEKSESTTAVGILARVFAGEDPRKSESIRKGAALLSRLPPLWEDGGRIDMYYWYYGTLAMFQIGGKAWETWNASMKPAIVDHQRQDGDFCTTKGSWDPVGPWGVDGGRVYSTALMAMCLEVYYRYDRVFGAAR